ncbi:hypothetical protein AAXE64_27270 [Priestia megaterium]
MTTQNNGVQTNEQDVKVAQAAQEATIKTKELDVQIKEKEITLQQAIEQMKKDIEVTKLEVNERVELRKLDTEVKTKVIEQVGSTTAWITTVAAITAIWITQMQLQMEKVKQDEF